MNRRDLFNRFPRPAKPAILALAILLAARIAFLVPATDRMIQIDSRGLRALFMADLECDLRETSNPEILLLGTSRIMNMAARRLEQPLKLPPGSVLNLSSAGATFFHLETVLKRNPEVLDGAKVILLDVVPFQATYTAERGEFFLRFASMRQRMNTRTILSKVVGVGDFLLPVISHAQDPFQWHTGCKQLHEPPHDRYERLKNIRLSSFGPLPEAHLIEMRRRSGALGDVTLNFLFGVVGDDLLVPSDISSLLNIIDLAPDDCRIILAWLPYRDDLREIVKQSPKKSLRKKTFRELLQSIDDPKVELHWFEEASEIHVKQEEYKRDGAHFSPAGLHKVATTLAELARPHLNLLSGDQATPKP